MAFTLKLAFNPFFLAESGQYTCSATNIYSRTKNSFSQNVFLFVATKSRYARSLIFIAPYDIQYQYFHAVFGRKNNQKPRCDGGKLCYKIRKNILRFWEIGTIFVPKPDFIFEQRYILIGRPADKRVKKSFQKMHYFSLYQKLCGGGEVRVRLRACLLPTLRN